MKTKSILVIVALLLFGTQSCDKYLEEELISDVAAASYYTTPAGLEDAVDGTYYYLRYIYSNERAYTLTTFGTDTYTNGADGGHKSFNYYDNGLNSESSMLSQMWENLYKGINQANAVLNRSANIADLDPARLIQRQAEVRFLRALYYFILVQQWGDVHLTLKETVGAEVTANKTPEAEIYAQAIIPDLEFAIANLLPQSDQPDWGRATKGAAEFLLGKVYLTRGYKVFGQSSDFANAETYLGNVINNYSYALESSIDKVFDQDNQKNNEIVFSVQYSKDPILNGSEGNRGHLYFLMEYDILPGMVRDIQNGRPFKRFRLTQYMRGVWGANRENDSRYDLTYKHVWYSNNPKSIPLWTQANVDAGATNADGSPAVVGQPKFAVGDTAIFIPGPGKDAEWPASRKLKTRYTVYTTDQYTQKIFAHTAKHIDPRRAAIQTAEGSRDFFVMRLADAYLLRAEARFNRGNPDGAAEDINVVRARAAWPGKEAEMMITGADVNIDFILEERARELDAEQERWYDLTRTGKLVERVKLYNPEAIGISDYHIHRPVPQTQIDRTQGGYPQNCGYPDGVCN